MTSKSECNNEVTGPQADVSGMYPRNALQAASNPKSHVLRQIEFFTIRAYLGSYLKKKGENLATHEDIDKLLAQVTAVTQATKEIEAKISVDVWERQKKWEIKNTKNK